MPRRSQREAVARRGETRLAEQHGRRRQAAQRGAQTRRQRREAQVAGPAAATAAPRGSLAAAEAQPQAGAESGYVASRPPWRPEGLSHRTQRHVARRSRPRVHADLLTVAIRGHFAERMRELSESHGMSLAKLLKDALLVYEGQIDAGYEPGTSLRQWQEQHAGDGEQAE